MHIHDIPYEELRAIYVSPQSKLNEDIAKSLDDLLGFASPGQYRDALMEIYQMYVFHEHKDLPEDFREIAGRLMVMMEFLKSCE